MNIRKQRRRVAIRATGFLRRRNGFTLIEGIIALGIISTTLVVGLSLAVSNLTASQDNSDRVIAGNLAREGIDLVRQQRDSNWIRRIAGISPNNWDNGMSFGYVDPRIVYPSGFFVFPPTNGYFQLVLAQPVNSTQYDLSSCMQSPSDGNSIQCQVRKGTVNGTTVYHQYTSAIANTLPTRFFRRLVIKSICWNSSSSVEYVHQIAPADGPITWGNCTGADTRIGVLVTSEVMWKRGSKTIDVTLKDRLYNWDNGYAARNSF